MNNSPVSKKEKKMHLCVLDNLKMCDKTQFDETQDYYISIITFHLNVGFSSKKMGHTPICVTA